MIAVLLLKEILQRELIDRADGKAPRIAFFLVSYPSSIVLIHNSTTTVTDSRYTIGTKKQMNQLHTHRYEVINTPAEVILVMEYAPGELFRYIVEHRSISEDTVRHNLLVQSVSSLSLSCYWWSYRSILLFCFLGLASVLLFRHEFDLVRYRLGLDWNGLGPAFLPANHVRFLSSPLLSSPPACHHRLLRGIVLDCSSSLVTRNRPARTDERRTMDDG